MMLRFRTWRELLERAGLPAHPSAGPSRTFDADDACDAIVAAWRELGTPPTVVAYDRWSPTAEGRPSSATIRKHFDSWDDALLLAWHVVHGETVRGGSPHAGAPELPADPNPARPSGAPEPRASDKPEPRATDKPEPRADKPVPRAPASDDLLLFEEEPTLDDCREELVIEFDEPSPAAGAQPGSTLAFASVLAIASVMVERYAQSVRPESLTESRALRLPVAVGCAEGLAGAGAAVVVGEERRLALPPEVFTGAGAVDLVVELPALAPTRVPRIGIELKAGRAHLVEVAWDLLKLAALLRAGELDRAVIIACAPQPVLAVRRAGTGVELLPAPGRRVPVDAELLVNPALRGNYYDAFASWARTGNQSPVRIPKLLWVTGLAEAPIEWTDRAGTEQHWLLRAAELTLASDVDWEWPQALRP